MLRDYRDITSRLGQPLWFDSNGVPRYDKFHPDLCGIYDDYVAYIELGCQGCSKTFMVSVERRKFRMWPKVEKNELPEPPNEIGSFHYGDPPRHDIPNPTVEDVYRGGWSLHCSGVTMNSFPIRIVEFWEKNKNFHWERTPDLEFVFPLKEEH